MEEISKLVKDTCDLNGRLTMKQAAYSKKILLFEKIGTCVVPLGFFASESR